MRFCFYVIAKKNVDQDVAIQENLALKACLNSTGSSKLIEKINAAKRECFGGDSEFDWNDFADLNAVCKFIKHIFVHNFLIHSGPRPRQQWNVHKNGGCRDVLLRKPRMDRSVSFWLRTSYFTNTGLSFIPVFYCFNPI